jgi:hypothetical protein
MIHIRTTVCNDTNVLSVTCSNTDKRTLVMVTHGARVRITHITVIVRILYILSLLGIRTLDRQVFLLVLAAVLP